MFPGGGIDEHETDRVASAVRELEEETHMTVH
jgi:8-oxo-dGTP pyrophosphatase MutT (NUDIX family)